MEPSHILSVFTYKAKGKGKVHLRTGHEGPYGELRYSSVLSLTSALDEMSGQRHASAVLPPGKTRHPFDRRMGRPQGRSGRVRKISPPTGIRSPDRPARSESLYRPRYPGPYLHIQIHNVVANLDPREEKPAENP
jgi:hypothetical protein